MIQIVIRCDTPLLCSWVSSVLFGAVQALMTLATTTAISAVIQVHKYASTALHTVVDITGDVVFNDSDQDK